MTSKVVKPSVINSDATCIHKIAILNWDDTLIPTTQILKNQQPSPQYTTINQLHNIGKLVYELLLKYTTLYGRQNIFIVTNASRKWVYMSLHLLDKMYKDMCTQFRSQHQEQILIERNKNYFESVKDLLISQEICIISGKDLYEKQYPKETGLWTDLIFKQIMRNIQNETVQKYSILSIGDSMDEFVAAKNATKVFTEPNVILHRIKLKYAPSLKEMTDEMRLIMALSDALYEEVSISQTIDYAKECESSV